MKDVLKLALEALCVAVEPKKGKVYAREFEPIDCFAMHEQAITALRETLAQPAQEPVLRDEQGRPMTYWGGKATPPAAQPAQDPDELTIAYMNGLYDGKKKRPWVGLTEEEIEHLLETRVGTPSLRYPIGKSDWMQFARAIEAKLKEKNFG
jgi:hypothetical protein